MNETLTRKGNIPEIIARPEAPTKRSLAIDAFFNTLALMEANRDSLLDFELASLTLARHYGTEVKLDRGRSVCQRELRAEQDENSVILESGIPAEGVLSWLERHVEDIAADGQLDTPQDEALRSYHYWVSKYSFTHREIHGKATKVEFSKIRKAEIEETAKILQQNNVNAEGLHKISRKLVIERLEFRPPPDEKLEHQLNEGGKELFIDPQARATRQEKHKKPPLKIRRSIKQLAGVAAASSITGAYYQENFGDRILPVIAAGGAAALATGLITEVNEQRKEYLLRGQQKNQDEIQQRIQKKVTKQTLVAGTGVIGGGFIAAEALLRTLDALPDAGANQLRGAIAAGAVFVISKLAKNKLEAYFEKDDDEAQKAQEMVAYESSHESPIDQARLFVNSALPFVLEQHIRVDPTFFRLKARERLSDSARQELSQLRTVGKKFIAARLANYGSEGEQAFMLYDALYSFRRYAESYCPDRDESVSALSTRALGILNKLDTPALEALGEIKNMGLPPWGEDLDNLATFTERGLGLAYLMSLRDDYEYFHKDEFNGNARARFMSEVSRMKYIRFSAALDKKVREIAEQSLPNNENIESTITATLERMIAGKYGSRIEQVEDFLHRQIHDTAGDALITIFDALSRRRR